MKNCVKRNLCAGNRVCKQARRARANVLRGRDACPQRSCARCLHARAAPLVRDCARPRGRSYDCNNARIHSSVCSNPF